MKSLGKYTFRGQTALSGEAHSSVVTLTPSFSDGVNVSQGNIATRIISVDMRLISGESVYGDYQSDAPDLKRFVVDTDLAKVQAVVLMTNALPQFVVDEKVGYFYQEDSGDYVEHRPESSYHLVRKNVTEPLEISSQDPRSGNRIHIGFDYDNAMMYAIGYYKIEVERVQLTADEVILYSTNIPPQTP